MRSMENLAITLLLTTSSLFVASAVSFRESVRGPNKADPEKCDQLISPELKVKIAGYQNVSNSIIELITEKEFKGQTYKELAALVDRYPTRPTGFQSLEDAIDYMMTRMEHFGLVNVRGEQVQVPHWVRGEESAELVAPIKKNIPLLGLGRSVGTPPDGINAPVLVVRTFDELEAKKDQVAGKIVVYNQGWINNNYGDTVQYRSTGATRASKYGALATLIESVAPFSLNNPHTGTQQYGDDVTHIPSACITKEDAEMLYRMQERGDSIRIQLKMMDQNLPMTTSRNAIGEIVGSSIPTEYVAVSGHIDSWDVGQGAMDDGGGVMISVMALAALKKLDLKPKRTMQAILWTCEEFGFWGAKGFVEQHKDMLLNYSVVFESDIGTFKPRGLDFSGSEEAGCIVREVLKLLNKIGATEFAQMDSVSSDISLLEAEGVPGISNNNENDHYFWYHHSPADTMTMIDSGELDLNTAMWAVTSYVLADISEKLPRKEIII